jgi:hypothetical protein
MRARMMSGAACGSGRQAAIIASYCASAVRASA